MVDIKTIVNLFMAFVIVYAGIYVLWYGGRGLVGQWRVTAVLLTVISALVRATYYIGTLLWGWNRVTHGDIVALINPVSLLGAALVLFSWLKSEVELRAFKKAEQDSRGARANEFRSI